MKKIILIFILISLNQNAFSNNLFKSKFYDVEFISNNIETEKINYIRNIKEISILEIFKKTLTIDDNNKIQNILSEDLINTFIQNIIIEDEKIINDKYIAKIKINFNKKKIINFYRSEEISYIEFNPNKFLLIIYEEDKINKNLFTKNNSYYKYFKENNQNDTFFKIPNLDLNDRYILNKDDLINKNSKSINKFAEKYKLNDLIIVLLKKNNQQTNFNFIFYSDNKFIEKYFEIKNNDYKIFFELLSYESIDAWKKINNIQNKNLKTIVCEINYFNIFELKEIRNKLHNVSIIKDLYINSLSYKNIKYEIHYYGDLKVFNDLLNINQLVLDNKLSFCKIRLK